MFLIIILKSDSSVVLLGWVVLAGNFLGSSCELRLELGLLVLGHVFLEQSPGIRDLSLLVNVVISNFAPKNALVVLNHLSDDL